MAKVAVTIKMFPEAQTEESRGLTRFQTREKQAKFFGKVHRLMNLDVATCTITEVKELIERETGVRMEYLRKGETSEGVILGDGKTLKECGVKESMDVYEYLWEDSKENVEKYAEEKERMFKILPYHERFMEDFDEKEPKKVPGRRVSRTRRPRGTREGVFQRRRAAAKRRRKFARRQQRGRRKRGKRDNKQGVRGRRRKR